MEKTLSSFENDRRFLSFFLLHSLTFSTAVAPHPLRAPRTHALSVYFPLHKNLLNRNKKAKELLPPPREKNEFFYSLFFVFAAAAAADATAATAAAAAVAEAAAAAETAPSIDESLSPVLGLPPGALLTSAAIDATLCGEGRAAAAASAPEEEAAAAAGAGGRPRPALPGKRGEPAALFLQACERLLRPSAADQSS